MHANQYTEHANLRCQQRGISPLVVDLLMEFGASEPAGDGTTKFYFNKPARKRLAAYAGRLAAILEQYIDVFAIVAPDNRVITVAHRTERIHRN